MEKLIALIYTILNRLLVIIALCDLLLIGFSILATLRKERDFSDRVNFDSVIDILVKAPSVACIYTGLSASMKKKM